MPKKRCLDAGPGPDVKARLEALLARVRRIRESCYPAGWTADPLYLIEKDLLKIVDLGRGPASAP